MNKIKKILSNCIEWFSPFLRYARLSFSQEGEDLILLRILQGQPKGYYIDVGAHHPYRFSNTQLLYKKGWRGINIDPMPERMKLFDKFRPNDINLEIGIAKSKSILTYYEFDEPALNNFSKSKTEEYLKEKKYKLIRERQIKTVPLCQILDAYLPINQRIDLLTIDVEGLDYEVLLSSNWEKYRPKYILVESHKLLMDDLITEDTYLFLKEKGYSLMSKTYYTCIYVNQMS